MDKLKMHSPNLTQKNIDRIRELFPNCVTEASGANGKVKLAVDFDLLRQELSESIVEGPQERYRLDWPGKREALLTANAPIAKTLRPCREESVDFDTTKNLYIEGDNLDALKLLQETYLGKVKMIYIDPPYNTGNDFIYEDDFAENTDEFLHRSNQKDEDGNRLVANTESNGRFHSNWLSMMYPRLKLARNLLAEDGVIFVSMDDNESSNLNLILSQIFGEKNFSDTLAVEMSTTSGPKTVNAQQGTIVKNVEFIYIYSKSTNFNSTRHTPLFDGVDSYDTHYSIWMDDSGKLRPLVDILLEDDGIVREIKQYNLLKNGKFNIKKMDVLLSTSEKAKDFIEKNLSKIARVDRAPVSATGEVTPVGHWKLFDVDHRTYFLTTLANGTLQALMPLSLNYRISDDYKPRFGRTVIRGDLWKGFHQDMGNVSKEGDLAFANGKKPVRLIKQLAKWALAEPEAIVLDFFSGSATTAHAVMQLNAEDGGNRKFIMVQLPEPCEEKSEPSKAGFKTIAEIGKARIRRAGAKIKAELAERQSQNTQGSLLDDNTQRSTPLDIGFRVLKVDSSNMADVYYTPDTLTQSQLSLFTDNIKIDRLNNPEDLLFQVLLDWGVDLTLPIRKQTILGKTVFFVDENALVACFDTGLTEELVKELTRAKPLRVVFRDNGFSSDAVKINATQIFRQMSPGTEVKAI